uniref:Uncharacterized protein n=1 Tax=Arundo donax TaxID=35708 RepID=A0A0A9HPF2_ARUDO
MLFWERQQLPDKAAAPSSTDTALAKDAAPSGQPATCMCL